MTARRDLGELERQGLARRTHGGAVLPAISAHEDSFVARLETAPEAKRALANAAVATIAPRESVFLDSSSTAYFVAQRLVETGTEATVITNSLPIMELVSTSATPNIDLIGVCGTLRRLTRSFVGPYAVHTVLGHFADRLFLSVKGLTRGGALTDADPLEAEVKAAMIAHASEATLLIDDSKLQARGLNAVGRLADLAGVLTCGAGPEALEALRASGVDVRAIDEGKA
jgi:DeoR/GlpR family transcriptional regulator of sugar metabolism